DDRAAPAFDDLRNAETTAQERAEQIDLDDAPEFFDRGSDDRTILRARSTRIIVKDVEPTELPNGRGNRALHALLARDIGLVERRVATLRLDQANGLGSAD